MDENNDKQIQLTKVTYTEEDKQLFRATVFKNVPEFQFQQGWHIIETWGIDLWMPGQFFVTPRYDKKTGAYNYQYTVGHPVLLKLAHQLGMKELHHDFRYAPDDIREEHPISDTVTIVRFDGGRYSKPTYFSDYNTGVQMWATKPHVMLAKCAEAACIRVAFELYGLYTREEMGEAMEDEKMSRDDSIGEEEKTYSEATFKSRKEREAVKEPVKAEPASVTDKKYNAFDLSARSLSEAEMNNMVAMIKCDFIGQTVSDEERDACRRSDGLYDYAAASVLMKSKRDEWNKSRGA